MRTSTNNNYITWKKNQWYVYNALLHLFPSNYMRGENEPKDRIGKHDDSTRVW